MTLIVAQHCNALAAAQWLDFKSPCCCTTLAKLARKDFRLYRLSHFAPYIMCGVGTVASSHLMGLAIGLGPQQGKTRCPEVFQNLKNCATLLTNCQDDLNIRNARAVTGVGSSSDESDTDITKGGVSFYAFLLFQMFTDIFFSFTSSSYTLQASGQVSFLYMFTLTLGSPSLKRNPVQCGKLLILAMLAFWEHLVLQPLP